MAAYNNIFLYLHRVYQLYSLYILLVSGFMEFCPNDAPVNQSNNSINSETNTSNINGDVQKFTDIAKDITFYTACFELGLGLLTFSLFLIKFLWCTKGVSCPFACSGFARNRWLLCCFHSESYIDAFTDAIQPFLMIDAIFILTVAPISSIHPLLITCTTGYILVGLRLLTYVLTFGLLFIFRYYKYNKFKMGRLGLMAVRMVGLFINLVTISSSLATLIKLGIPEIPGIRYTYATATFIIVIITYINYYTLIDKLRTETANTKTRKKSVCYEVINHTTYWVKLLFGNLVLIVLNAIILNKHYNKEGFRYAGVSLIMAIASTIFSISMYIFLSQFCQRKTLCDVILERCWKTHCKPKLITLKNHCSSMKKQFLNSMGIKISS